jgi:Spore germination protein
MKKFIMYLMFIVILAFTGCGKDSNPTTPTTPTTPENNNNPKAYTISDYYPFKENIEMIYEGKGNEYASQTIMTDFIKDNVIQIRVNNGGTTLGRLIQNKNGELSILYNKEEFYYKDNLTTMNINTTNKEVILKEPLLVGTSWTLPNGAKRTITSTSININTPSGDYTALEVTTEGSDYTIKDYYVLNIGFVKSVFASKDFEVTTSLKEIRNNVPLTQSLQFFYPHNVENDIKVGFVKRNITLNTNEEIKNIFEQYFKNPPTENLIPLISKNTKINKLYPDTEKNVVMVDFSKELVSEMNAGSATEGAILKSITNSLARYYTVDKVYITIEGNPYSSGHFEMKKDEFFTVDFKDSSELK